MLTQSGKVQRVVVLVSCPPMQSPTGAAVQSAIGVVRVRIIRQEKAVVHAGARGGAGRGGHAATYQR
jgi:hypothetical protein